MSLESPVSRRDQGVQVTEHALPALELIAQHPEIRSAVWSLLIRQFREREEADEAASGSMLHTDLFQIYEELKASTTYLQQPEMGEFVMLIVQDSELARTFCREYKKLPWKDLAIARRAHVLAQAIVQQEEEKTIEETIHGEGYSIRLLAGVRSFLPEEFFERAYEYALRHYREPVKHDAKLEEIIWGFPAADPSETFIMKRTQIGEKKMPNVEYELRMLQRARLLGLPGPTPLGLMQLDHGGPAFTLMQFVTGDISGIDLYHKLIDRKKTPAQAEQGIQIVSDKLHALAQRFRLTMGIDKCWFIKDCLVYFDDAGEIRDIFPLDLERAHPFNPMAPDRIDTLDKIKERLARKKEKDKKAA